MSREKILGNIKINKPDLLPLNDFSFKSITDNLPDEFLRSVKSVGGNVIEKPDFNIEKSYPSVKNIGSKIPEYKSNIDLDTASLEELKSLEIAILKAEFGVAENGAVWLPETNMGQRIVPFIAERLVILLNHDEIVPTMHEAYDRINNLYSYGVFISGPSKTADIEQTLVLGAQGPLSLDIILID